MIVVTIRMTPCQTEAWLGLIAESPVPFASWLSSQVRVCVASLCQELLFYCICLAART